MLKPEKSVDARFVRVAAWAGVALALVVYARTFPVPFLLDDYAAGPLLSVDGELAGERVLAMIWPSNAADRYHDHFRPLAWASIVLDVFLFGYDAAGLRIAGLFWHAGNGLLVALLARRLFAERLAFPPALLCGLAFVVWPGAAEPVIWVCHRFTLLTTAATLTAAWLALDGRHSRSFAAAVAVCCAYLAKDSALTQCWAIVPLVGLAAAPGQRRRSWTRTSILVGLGLALGVGIRYACTETLLPSLHDGGNVVESLDFAEVTRGLPTTLASLFLPIGHGFATPADAATVLYPVHPASFQVPLVPATLFLVGPLSIAFAYAASLEFRRRVARRSSALPAAASFLAGTLILALPVLGSVHRNLEGFRHLYLPAAAVFVVMAGLLPRGPRLASLLMVGWILGSLPGLLHNQERYLQLAPVVSELQQQILRCSRRGETTLLEVRERTSLDPLLFGPELTHASLLATPPFFPAGFELIAVLPGQIASAGLATNKPLTWMRWPPDPSEPCWHGAALDSESGPDRSTLTRPAEGSLWPGTTGLADGAVIELRWPDRGAVSRRWRVLFRTDREVVVCVFESPGATDLGPDTDRVRFSMLRAMEEGKPIVHGDAVGFLRRLTQETVLGTLQVQSLVANSDLERARDLVTPAVAVRFGIR